MISVATQGFSGMTVPHGEYETVTDARNRVKARIRFLEKHGYEVEQMDPMTWEVTSEGLVDDNCGTLQIRKGPAHIM